MKLIVIGAGYLQLPAILKAREMGLETHVFAWEEGAVAKDHCDHFYPLSIVEKDLILAQARQIKPDGIVSIASDLAMNTVNYVAHHLGLTGNSLECTRISTNKYFMRQALAAAGLPCPAFRSYDAGRKPDPAEWTYPVIVKPVDRSGSRGVTKVAAPDLLLPAVERAMADSFQKRILVEEFVEGREISVEMISWKGRHAYLACTDKITTGAPYFVEVGHHQPAQLPAGVEDAVVALVPRALTALQVENGASHSELLITKEGRICIVEIGARMGGGNIGSDLVELSTGFDFTRAAIEVALGRFDPDVRKPRRRYAGIYFPEPAPGTVTKIIDRTPQFQEVVKRELFVKVGDRIGPLKDSTQRCGYFIYCSDAARWLVDKNHVLEIVTRPQ